MDMDIVKLVKQLGLGIGMGMEMGLGMGNRNGNRKYPQSQKMTV